MRAGRALAVLLTCVLSALSLSAREQVVIQKAGTNAQLRAANAWLDRANPATNNSAGTTLQVKSLAGNNAQRTLVLFDLSLLPNAGVKSATLTLHVVTAPVSARTYNASLLTSFWNQPDATWTNRVNTRPWGAAGGDFNGTVTGTAPITTTSNTLVNWTITPDVQSWYNGTPNYGTIIADSVENNASAITTIFSSMADATPANRPSLTLTFLQNVTGLTAVAGNGTVTLNWGYPTAIGSVLEAYTGVLILRSPSQPVTKAAAPTDLAVPALCATISAATVVFVSNTSATTFTDDATDTCGAPANGTNYFYKVFTRDSANNWSTNPSGLAAPRDGLSTFTAEACAMPNTAGNTQACAWMLGTHATNEVAPSLIPGGQVVIGTGTNLLFGVNATTGARLYPPVSLSGIISGRAPIVDSVDGSLGKKVAYVADQDNLVYAVDVTTGQILWLTNPTGLTTNAFQGGPAVLVKSFATGSYTLGFDLVIVGTHNAASTTTNQIVALNANTGAMVWTVTGSSGSTPAMDIISSTASVDYVHNAIWVTSRSAGGAGQPSLWKINANTGAVLFTANLNDIDSSVSLTAGSDVLFVGSNAGTLYAINPVTGATLKTFAGGDGAIRGFPDPANPLSPFTIVFTGSTKVQAVTYTSSTTTFASLWSTAITSPSSPLVVGKVYVGSSDGFLYELDPVTGVAGKKRSVDTSYPAVIGDPSIDTILSRIYVSTTVNDQRSYAYTIPF